MYKRFFGKLSNPEIKLNTDVFFGLSYVKTHWGAIQIEPEREGLHSKGRVTFTDANKQKTFGKLEVYRLHELKKLPIYKSATEIHTNEKWVNTWIARHNGNAIIKTAGDKQLAMIFTSDEVANDFEKLLSLNLGFGYFGEIQFCLYLKNTFGVSIEELRLMPGMDEPHIQFVKENPFIIEKMFFLGVMLKEIGCVDISRLEKIIEKNMYLDEALIFASIRQILGLDTKPVEIKNIPISKNNKNTSFASFENGQFNGYISQSSSSFYSKEVTITHVTKPGKFEAKSDLLYDDILADKFMKNIKAQTFIHDWYLSKEGDTKIIYCPELRIMMNETNQLAVPQSYLNFELSQFDFYKERNFCEFLKEQKCPIDRFRNYVGMTKQKLILLLKNQYAMEQMIKMGVKMEDFSRIEDLRLKYLLLHFNEIESALLFVPLSQILDLTEPPLENERKLMMK